MKLTKGKLIAAGIICGVLALTYAMGGGYAAKGSPPPKDSSLLSSETAETTAEAIFESAAEGALSGADQEKASLSAEEKLALAKSLGGGSSEEIQKGSADYSEAQGMAIDPETGKDKYLTDPVPEGRPLPVEPENATVTDRKMSCTISVRCDTILNNMKALDPEKIELVPEDGVIFPASKVTFYEGESVFNVLLREMKKNKIHMEFVNTPINNSAYIEGINNLYEFDCGELSGWMYKVNDWFPNYGCSRYQLKEGDVVEWVYTCDLGRDVGGYYSAGGTK